MTSEVDLLSRLADKTLLDAAVKARASGDRRTEDLCRRALRLRGYEPGRPTATPGLREHVKSVDPWGVQKIITYEPEPGVDPNSLSWFGSTFTGGPYPRGNINYGMAQEARRGGRVEQVFVPHGEKSTTVKA